MANAPNRMTRRLAIAIATYIDRYGAWPTEARLSAEAMYWVAHTLDAVHFARLADRLKMRVTKHSDIAIGGTAGHLVYPASEEPNFEIVERVERELGFDDVDFDPPSQTLVDLTASLFGHEVFHQLVLDELLAMSDLGQRLGIWHYAQPPTVVYEPRRGLFDLGLAQFGGGAESPIEVYLELKVGSHLETEQFQRQQAGAVDAHTVYFLLGPTYFRWRHVESPRFIGVVELAQALAAVGANFTGSAGELARVYGARLDEEARRWSQPLDPSAAWEALDYFRFYAEIAPTWPVDVHIYPVTNRSGPQYILNAPSAWARPAVPGWDEAQVYWELVDGRLRYKVTTEQVEDRRRLRDEWRQALHAAAAELGEVLTQPRSATGRSMTAAELGGDIRGTLVRNGQLDPVASQALHDRAARIFTAAVERLGPQP